MPVAQKWASSTCSSGRSWTCMMARSGTRRFDAKQVFLENFRSAWETRPCQLYITSSDSSGTCTSYPRPGH